MELKQRVSLLILDIYEFKSPKYNIFYAERLIILRHSENLQGLMSML